MVVEHVCPFTQKADRNYADKLKLTKLRPQD
jgi:hypothetical protein